MLNFSKREDYAFLLISSLAERYNKGLVSLATIALKYQISANFLRQIANPLRRKGLIGAKEGKKGGYFLKKSPKELRLREIFNAFSKKPFPSCYSSACPRQYFCEPGFAWRKLNKKLLGKIYNLSFENFIKNK